MSHRLDKLDQIRQAALSSTSGGEQEGSWGDINGMRKPQQPSPAGRLEELKQQEAELSRQLAEIRMEKLAALRSRPLTIGIVGFGRFGQFIARTFAKHGKIVVTSRSDYTDIANGMGATYIPLSDPDAFLENDLDVIILAVSILSFESTIMKLAPSLKAHIARSKIINNKGPLLVDVLSVKEHPREVLLKHLPEECDILCTHPMFGPDSGANGWRNLNFVYEKTRVDKVVFDPIAPLGTSSNHDDTFVDTSGTYHSIHEDSEAHVEAMDRVERFLSIWEEEGCRMVPLSCKAHDEYAANSQFITHLMGRILGAQGLSKTPIDTKGFQSVLKLVDSTTADSFDLFYGLYKHNQNSMSTIMRLKAAMDDVVDNLKRLEKEDLDKQQKEQPEEAIQEEKASPS
jgi:arogenate dehydrogenase (NADP+)